MLAGNDVSQVLFGIFVTYYSNYGNRPRWLGLGIFSASLSCFISALPHFIYGPGDDAIEIALNSEKIQSGEYTVITNDSKSKLINSSHIFFLTGIVLSAGLCYAPYVKDCSGEDNLYLDASVIWPLTIFFTAQFFVGLAITVFYSIGFVYLDDNVSKKESPVYYSKIIHEN